MMQATAVQSFAPPPAVRSLALVACRFGRPHHAPQAWLELALVGVVIGPLGVGLQRAGGPQPSPEMPRVAVHDRGSPGS
jgi:hypothetical protein